MTQEQRLAEIRARIVPEFLSTIAVGPGWYDLVIDLDTQIREVDPSYRIAQVKEKFGGLRFYLAGEPARADEINALIEAAEVRSIITCEECGQPGTTRNVGGWWGTLCDQDAAQRAVARRTR